MSSLRSLTGITAITLLFACGSEERVQAPDVSLDTQIEAVTALRTDDRVDITFTLQGDPVDRVEILRRVQRVDGVQTLAVLESPAPGVSLSVTDSSIYSGHEHAYGVRVPGHNLLSEWVSVGRVPGPTLNTFTSMIGGAISLSWTYRPTGVEHFQIIRRGGGSEIVVHEGPSEVLGLTDDELQIGVNYRYQITSTFRDGFSLVSWERSARLYQQAGIGRPSIMGTTGETTVVDAVEGLPIIVVARAGMVSVGHQNALSDFGFSLDFEDPTAGFLPGSTSAIGIPEGGGQGPSSTAGSDFAARFLVTGLIGDQIVGRVYTRIGTVLRELTWPAIDGETRTFATIAPSEELDREVVFLATEKRSWEITSHLQSGTPHPLPTQQGAGIAFVSNHLVALESGTSTLFMAPYSRATKNGEPMTWGTVDLPEGTRPVAIAAPGTERSNRVFVLDESGKVVTFDLNLKRTSTLILPTGDYSNGRLHMLPPRPILPKDFRGFAVTGTSGTMRIYIP
jgi:hypothetical protein